MSGKSRMTPGKWHCLSGERGKIEISASVGPHWAASDNWVGTVSERNARAIACLPELIEAARDLANEIDAGPKHTGMTLEYLDNLRRILARIEGSDNDSTVKVTVERRPDPTRYTESRKSRIPTGGI